ncbi:hypothetical protein LTR27_006133 [Elasticomyces elasticus]|nr:hypothetical protein LTR27_006133 [Elasticomyces elasticus]
MGNDLSRLAGEHDKAQKAPSTPRQHVSKVKLEDETGPDCYNHITSRSSCLSGAELRKFKREGSPIDGQLGGEVSYIKPLPSRHADTGQHNTCTKRIKLEDEEVKHRSHLREQGVAIKQESPASAGAPPPQTGMVAQAPHPLPLLASTDRPERQQISAADHAPAQADELGMPAVPAYQHCPHTGINSEYRRLNEPLGVRQLLRNRQASPCAVAVHEGQQACKTTNVYTCMIYCNLCIPTCAATASTKPMRELTSSSATGTRRKHDERRGGGGETLEVTNGMVHSVSVR